MWSPVRWVALLVKLQLPLRTFQIRMLDSGEADTWRWQDGEWAMNKSHLVIGTESRPYANGVFLRPTELVDGDAKVLLHINTNKTADIGKEGNQKGYNVPWLVGGLSFPRFFGPVRFLVCRGHETITEITSYDRCNRDQEEQEPEGAEAVPR
nr:VPA1269 family protein [Burkholderia multivorans]